MTYLAMLQALRWAIRDSRAVPGAHWTTQRPEARITYWTDADGVEHVETKR